MQDMLKTPVQYAEDLRVFAMRNPTTALEVAFDAARSHPEIPNAFMAEVVRTIVKWEAQLARAARKAARAL